MTERDEAMNWIVLAAGRGKRLNPLTNVLQKCMYPIAGKPFLQYTLDGLLAECFDIDHDTLTIVVGHHADQVTSYFGTEYRGAEVRYVWQNDQFGTGHAVFAAHTSLRLTGPAVVWLGDVYFEPATLRAVSRAAGDALCYVPLEHTTEAAASPLLVEDGLVQSMTFDFAEDEAVGNAADIGCYRLTQSTRDSLPRTNREGEWRIIRALLERHEDGHEIEAVRAPEWLHLGNTPSTLDCLGRVTRRLAPMQRSSEVESP